MMSHQNFGCIAGAEGVAVPAYLSDHLDQMFTLVRGDTACPFCGAAKNAGSLACYSCYGAEVLRELDPDDLAILERREAALAAARERVVDESAAVEPDRSPEDARSLSVLSSSLLVMAAAMVLFLGLALWAGSYWFERRAAVRREVPVSVFEPGGVRPVDPVIDPGVTDEDRRTAALLFVKAIYDVDRETRARDLKTAVLMMTPEAAEQFVRLLKESEVREHERRDAVRAWWQRESVEIDPVDPSLVRLRGRQMFDRVEELPAIAVPMRINLKLIADRQGRTPQNQMTGLRIGSFEARRMRTGAG